MLASQISHGCVDPTLSEGNVRQSKAHLNPTECSHQHEVIEIAQMADAENDPPHFAQTRSEGHIEVLQNGFPEFV